MCLPVLLPDDVWFQFVIMATTEEEADALCSQDTQPVTVGSVVACSDALTPFSGNLMRYRISATQVLYAWQDGITTLETIDIGQCFRIGVEVLEQFFCSNCFQRILEDCHTSVIQYGSTDNSFGFNYCASTNSDETGDAACEPLILEFSNQTNMVIPWTAYLQGLYGDTPSVQVWIYDGGELVAAGIRVAYDTYPPTELRMDFGGTASGVVKIM